MVGELDERQGRQHLDLTARPGGLRPAGGGTDEAVPATIRGDRCRQDPGDGCQRAIERQLTERGEALERVGRNGTDGGHDAERDREVVVRALLREVSRRKIDDDAPCGQREA